MKPAPFAFHRPGSLADALAILAGEPEAKVLAGGQSLVPLLSMRLASPSALVDINGLPDLSSITVTGDGVRIGALVRHAELLASLEAREVQPLVALALAHVAHPTIRNRGTTVGSLVHADAAAEMPVVLSLLGGSVDVAGPGGTRTIPASELYVGPMESAVHHGEIATSAFFPAAGPGTGAAFDEIARRHGDYALAGVAAVVRVQDGEVVEARAGFVSVSDVPAVVDLMPALTGGVTALALADLGDHVLTELDPLSDIHATASYRAQLVRVLTTRVVGTAYQRALTVSDRATEGGTA